MIFIFPKIRNIFQKLQSRDIKIIFYIIIFKVAVLAIGYYLAHFIPLENNRYYYGYHHVFLDSRYLSNRVEFLQLWAYGDAQWYQDIAMSNYGESGQDSLDSQYINDKKYNFFPLWPLIIKFFQIFLHDTVMSMFVATQLFGVLAFYFFYKLVTLYFNDDRLALRSLFLFMLFPFSIFFHLYYSESIFLFLAVIVFISLKQDKWVGYYLASFLIILSRPNGIVITIPVFAYLINKILQLKNNLFPVRKQIISLALFPLASIGLGFYMFYCYLKTGDWFKFITIQKDWNYAPLHFFDNIKEKVSLLFHFRSLGFHEYGSSKIEYLVMLLSIFIIIVSIKKMPREFTLFSVLIWVFPLILKNDSASYGRYISVAFPIFIALAMLLKKFYYISVVIVFIAGYLLTLAGVISWRYIG